MYIIFFLVIHTLLTRKYKQRPFVHHSQDKKSPDFVYRGRVFLLHETQQFVSIGQLECGLPACEESLSGHGLVWLPHSSTVHHLLTFLACR